jgi:hypothetical protein
MLRCHGACCRAHAARRVSASASLSATDEVRFRQHKMVLKCANDFWPRSLCFKFSDASTNEG